MSVIGAVCGVGGGVLIKPALDAMNCMSVASVSFLSGCTVLSMSAISAAKNLKKRETAIGKQTLPLGIGAAVGGLLGKELLQSLLAGGADAQKAGLAQSVLLAAVCLATLLYMYREASGRVQRKNVKSNVLAAGIGLALGLISAFLGIGGGPMNLAVLSYFFSMDTKEAAANSLCVIFLSQTASLLLTLITRTVPDFHPLYLILMVLGGVLGGFLGHGIRAKIKSQHVTYLLGALLLAVIAVSLKNALHFL